VFLACKVEEFYVPINDYIFNVKGTDEEKKLTAVTILNSELQTSQELQFHLVVHQPYRAVEGLLIDIKTRFGGTGIRCIDTSWSQKHNDIIIINVDPLVILNNI